MNDESSLANFNNQMSQYLSSVSTLDLGALILSLIVGFVLSLFVRWHYSKYGSTLSNRHEFGTIFPMIILTITLIIAVVKSSLALALGLVGALSIVRFRTPIKEPEELAYLFLIIGLGLALGAGQIFAAIGSAAVILSCITVVKLRKNKFSESGLYLSLDWKPSDDETTTPTSNWLEMFEKNILEHVISCDLRRFDERNGCIEALYYVDVEKTLHLSQLSKKLRGQYKGIGITFLDQKNVSGF